MSNLWRLRRVGLLIAVLTSLGSLPLVKSSFAFALPDTVFNYAFLNQPPLSCTGNVLTNEGFESGSTGWHYFSANGGNFTTSTPAYNGNSSAKVTVNNSSGNIQFYQFGLNLQPNTAYRLSFAAQSTAGRDLRVNLHEHDDDITSYGLRNLVVDLQSSWTVHTVDFTTSGFSSPVNDGRLRLWLANYAQAGDVYWFDDLCLTELTNLAPTPTPTDLPAATATPTLTNTPVVTGTPTLTPTPITLNGAWPYSVALTVNANGHERTNKIAETFVNFTQLFAQVAESGAFDEQSIQVVEVDTGNNIINGNVPFQFDQDPAYNASTYAAGKLVFQMAGTTPGSGDRHYQIFFGPVGETYTPITASALITTTVVGIQDEGQDSYKFELASGTYYYQHQSGGFSSINDMDGNDWVSHSTLQGTAGEFRGIPNLIYPEGGFHPGHGGSTSQVLHNGPLKVTYVTTDGSWQALWEIYPEYVRMTLLQSAHNYWFLYEGTPGGELTTSDYYVLSDGPTQYNAYSDIVNSTDPDIAGEEWIYFVDPNVGAAGRALFFAHHEDDTFVDSYRRLGSTASNNAMTVFGFGRQHVSTLMSQVPQHFTFGLLETADYTQASTAINGAYKELSITLGTAEVRTIAPTPTPTPSPTLTPTSTPTEVPPPTPGQSTLLAPFAETSGQNPEFSWTEAMDATDYILIVYDVSAEQIIFSNSYSSASICSLSICRVETGLSFVPGTYQWLVRGENGNLLGDWSTYSYP